MRTGLAIGLFVGLILGASLGLVVSSNFYEYHVLDTTRGERVPDLVNQGVWEPMPGSFIDGSTRFYRRPRIRLGG